MGWLATVLRLSSAPTLLAGISAQIALYMAVTFAVYLEPKNHIEASFAHILAALATPRIAGRVYNRGQ